MVELNRNVISKDTQKGFALLALEDRVIALEDAVNEPTVGTITNGVAATFATQALAAGKSAAGYFEYAVKVDDGTVFQCVKGRIQWTAVAKGDGTITVTLGAPAQILAESDNTKTLDVTFTATTLAGVISFKVNANSNLVPTSMAFSFVTQTF